MKFMLCADCCFQWSSVARTKHKFPGPAQPYLDHLHERVVAALEELYAQLLQHHSDAVGGYSFLREIQHRTLSLVHSAGSLLSVVRVLFQC